MTLGGGGRELTRPEVSQHPMAVAWEAAMFRDNGCLCGDIPHPPWQLLVLTRSSGSLLISVPSALSQPEDTEGVWREKLALVRDCIPQNRGCGLVRGLTSCQVTDFLAWALASVIQCTGCLRDPLTGLVSMHRSGDTYWPDILWLTLVQEITWTHPHPQVHTQPLQAKMPMRNKAEKRDPGLPDPASPGET